MVARLIGIAICLLLVSPSPAGAAPSRVDSPERRLAAKEFKVGKALYAAGDYDGALAAFRNGFEAYPLRGFLVNIGQCYRKLGQLREAAEAYEQFLEGTDIAPGLRAEVEDALAEVRGALGSAAPERPSPSRADPEPAEPPSAAPVTPEAPSAAPVTPDRPELVQRAPEQHSDKKKVRPWVWALVGVGAAVVVAGVTVGVVVGTRPHDPSAGSLGLIDGRTR